MSQYSSPKSPSSPNQISARLPSVRFLGINGNDAKLQPVQSFLSSTSSFSSFLTTPQQTNLTVSADPFAPSNAYSYNSPPVIPHQNSSSSSHTLLKPQNSFYEDQIRKNEERESQERKKRHQVVKMFPLASALPKLQFEKTEAVEKPHYSSFSPRKIRSGWKTAESVSDERSLGRTLSTMMNSRRRLSGIISNDHDNNSNNDSSFGVGESISNIVGGVPMCHYQKNLLKEQNGDDCASPKTRAVRATNSFILEEKITGNDNDDDNEQQKEERFIPRRITHQAKPNDNCMSPEQQSLTRARSLFCPAGDEVLEKATMNNNTSKKTESEKKEQDAKKSDEALRENAAISQENRTQVRRRRSVISAANIGDVLEWTPSGLEEEIFTEDDREVVADLIHQYMVDLVEFAVRVLPPPPDVNDDNARGTSELSQLTLRKLLPTLKRKILGSSSASAGSGGSNLARKGGRENQEQQQQQHHNFRADIMGKLAPEWLVNGKTLHSYAQQHLDTLLVRSILSLPDCPHIRHILFLHITMTPARLALLLHKGFGTTSSSFAASIASISSVVSPNGKAQQQQNINLEEFAPMLDESEMDVRDPLQRALDEGNIPLITGTDKNNNNNNNNNNNFKNNQSTAKSLPLTGNDEARQAHDFSLKDDGSASLLESSFNNNNNNMYNPSKLSSLCLAFCQVESDGAQILFEWMTFAPSAVSLTALDVSHNKLENRIVPHMMRAIQRGTLKHLNLRGNPNLFVGTVGNLATGASDGGRGFHEDKSNNNNNDRSSSQQPPTSGQVSGLRLTKSVVIPSIAYLPATPAIFLKNVKDYLVTLEVSLCGVTAEHMLPIVNAIPHYNFASLSFDNVEISTRAAATLLENLTQNTNLVHLSLKFIVACSSKLYQERLQHLLSRNLELFYDAKVFQVLMEKYGDVENTPKRAIQKVAQAAFLELQPHFSTGTPSDLLESVKQSSLHRALQGELVQTTFFMKRTTSGKMKIKGKGLAANAVGSGSLAGGNNTNEEHENRKSSNRSSPSPFSFMLPSERIARQLARDEDEDSDVTLVASEVERECHLTSALPPGYGPYYSNEPTKTMQKVQFSLLKKRDEQAAQLNLELQQREQLKNILEGAETASANSSTTTTISTGKRSSASTATMHSV